MADNKKTNIDDQLDALVDQAMRTVPDDLTPPAHLRTRVLNDFDRVYQAKQKAPRQDIEQKMAQGGFANAIRIMMKRLFGVSPAGAFTSIAASAGLGVISAFALQSGPQSGGQIATAPQTPEALLLAELSELEETFGAMTETQEVSNDR